MERYKTSKLEVYFPDADHRPEWAYRWIAGEQYVKDPDLISPDSGACWKAWTACVYADSIRIGDWQRKLARAWGQPLYISPLHDKDIHQNGNRKDAHYHVVFVGDNPVPFEKINYLIKHSTGRRGVPYAPIPCNGEPEKMICYMTHLTKDARTDGKHIYSPLDIQVYNDESSIFDHVPEWYLDDYNRCVERGCGTWAEYKEIMGK